MLEHFTPDAARALPGPEWLATRRGDGDRTPRRRRVADRRRGDLALQPHRRARPLDSSARYRRSRWVSRATSPRPAAVPIAAEAGERSGLVVVRNGRVVHHALDADARGQGRAGVRHRHLRRRRDRHPARHLLRRVARRVHRAARRVPRRRRLREGAARRRGRQADRGPALVGGRRPRVVPAHPGGRRRRRRGHGVRPLRVHRHPCGGHRSLRRRRRRADRRRQRARALPLGAGARAAHVAGRAAARAPRPRRVAEVVGGRARR